MGSNTAPDPTCLWARVNLARGTPVEEAASWGRGQGANQGHGAGEEGWHDVTAPGEERVRGGGSWDLGEVDREWVKHVGGRIYRESARAYGNGKYDMVAPCDGTSYPQAAVDTEGRQVHTNRMVYFKICSQVHTYSFVTRRWIFIQKVSRKQKISTVYLCESHFGRYA